MRDDREHGKTATDPWADLVLAILSVNNYPLDKTFALFEALSENGLFDPAMLAAIGQTEVAQRLGAAGYNRGGTMTAIFTDRLVSLGRLTSRVPIDECNAVLASGTRDEVSSLLSSVKGVGPKVLDNFFVLRGDS